MRCRGLPVRADDAGIAIELAARGTGPTLALASHLDVVPAGEGWRRAPFDPSLEEGVIYGRGAADAKASVAAMLLAARDLAGSGGPGRGRLLVLLSLGEESRSPSMPAAVERAGPIDAAIVGEPTGLDFAVAQRGLLIAELRARGAQHHAAHPPAPDGPKEPSRRSRPTSSVSRGCFTSRAHPLLGQARATPTMLSAGVARNVSPGEATAVLDVRTTPDWTHAEIVSELQGALRSEVRVLSERLVPCATPEGSRILACARGIRPASRLFGSPTCSDWVFLRQFDVLKCGPGDSRQSHGPDECVRVDEVAEARRFYGALAREYLA